MKLMHKFLGAAAGIALTAGAAAADPALIFDLGGKFDLKLSISTPEADEAKAKELAFMLQTTGQTMGPAFSQIILSDIAKLRKMPDLVFYNDDSLEYINNLENAVKGKENPIMDTDLLDKRKNL